MFRESSIVGPVMSTPVSEALRRHQPRQQRARERVEAILDAAEALIAEQGHASLNLSAVAQSAQVPIGSIYQYFGGLPALLRALAERYMQAFAMRLESVLDQRHAGAEQQLAAILDAYLAFYREAQVYQRVRAAAAGDPALRKLDLADSRANAQRLLARLPPELAADEDSLFLACEQTGSFAALLADRERQGAAEAELATMRGRFLRMLQALLVPHLV